MIIKSKHGNYSFDIIKDYVKELNTINNKILIIDSFIDNMSFDLEKKIIINTNEFVKSYNNIGHIINTLLEMDINKNTNLVAIGGGIIQDIVGFISSILFRGINWYFFPTTLLSQCDSCIGSKTSINFNKYKNLIGTFYPPKKIFCDLRFLYTLSKTEIISGIGEMLHYFLLYDKTQLAKTMVNDIKIMDNIEIYIKISLEIKKQMIEIDELDKNERNIFNYGHTFGHAIESLTNYNIHHGQAVIIGMDMANFVALKNKYISEKKFNIFHDILKIYMPEFKLTKNELDVYIGFLVKDKKNKNNDYVTCILKNSFSAETVTLKKEQIKKILIDYFGL